MTIKPLDLQTNIAHMHEIAKAEQGRAAAYINGEQSLEKSSAEEAVRLRNKLDENKKAEKAIIMREEEHRKRKGGKSPHDENKDDEDEKDNLHRFENMGINIDVKR